MKTIDNWSVELKHACENWTKTMKMSILQDLKETDFVNFMGDVVYRTKIQVLDPKQVVLNLGKVWGISELYVNGKSCGVKWYGNRIYDLSGLVNKGENEIEVRVTTIMGNYVRTLKDNKMVQKFIGGRKEQPIQSMGMLGPVTLY